MLHRSSSFSGKKLLQSCVAYEEIFKTGNKTATINVKKLQFIYTLLTATYRKLQNHKKAIINHTNIYIWAILLQLIVDFL